MTGRRNLVKKNLCRGIPFGTFAMRRADQGGLGAQRRAHYGLEGEVRRTKIRVL